MATESEIASAEKRVCSSGESAKLSGSLPPYVWRGSLVESEDSGLPLFVSKTEISSRFVSATKSFASSWVRTNAVGCEPLVSDETCSAPTRETTRLTVPFTRSSSATEEAFQRDTNPRLPSWVITAVYGSEPGMRLNVERSKR